MSDELERRATYRKEFAGCDVNRQAAQATPVAVEPVAYRVKNNRGNGKFDYAYYEADRVATAYYDNCLEITPLYTTPPADPDTVNVPREPTPEMIEAGVDDAGGGGSARDWVARVYQAMIGSAK